MSQASDERTDIVIKNVAAASRGGAMVSPWTYVPLWREHIRGALDDAAAGRDTKKEMR